jgi:hypothetical protein
MQSLKKVCGGDKQFKKFVPYGLKLIW